MTDMLQPSLVCLLPEELSKPLALLNRKHRLQRKICRNQTAVMFILECSYNARKFVKKVEIGHGPETLGIRLDFQQITQCDECVLNEYVDYSKVPAGKNVHSVSTFLAH